jgi:hypothetical protein
MGTGLSSAGYVDKSIARQTAPLFSTVGATGKGVGVAFGGGLPASCFLLPNHDSRYQDKVFFLSLTAECAGAWIPTGQGEAKVRRSMTLWSCNVNPSHGNIPLPYEHEHLTLLACHIPSSRL